MPSLVQRTAALVGLILLSPVFVTIAAAIRIDSAGPVLFRATRIGRAGVPFVALKFRSMSAGAGGGPMITAGADPRVTRLGRRLRRYRIDELPQLWNVVRGEMLLVGPRPEDPRFVDPTDQRHAEVLTATPGITGLAQLVFADEARYLGADPERAYRAIVLPRKLVVDQAYVRHRSGALDARIIVETLGVVLGRRVPEALVDGLVGDASWRLPPGAEADPQPGA